MLSGSIARRYARALLQIGVDGKSYDGLGRELERIAHAYADSKELQTAVENPVFPLAERRAVVEELCRRLALSKTVHDFIMLLLERGRVSALPAIAREHRRLVDEHAGRVRAKVTSATALTPATEARLKAALEKRTGKVVILEKHEDPSLLGGVIAQIGDLVFDGSVRTRLETIRHELLHE